MGWVKLDDGFFRHPKVVGVGREARFLYLAGLCYCGANLTDGLIPEGALRVLAAEVEIRNPAAAARQLEAVGLWEACEGGYRVHDYLDYNRSSEKVRGEREAAAERMQRNRSGNVRANKNRTPTEVRETFALQDTDTETESDGVNPPEGPPNGAGAPPQGGPPDPGEPQKRKRRIGDSFVPAAAMTAWAGQELGLDPDTIRRETEKFTDHFRAKGEAKLDWAAAWRNWMRRAAEGAYGPAAPPLPRRVARPDRDIGLSNDELDRMIAAGDLP